VFAITACDFETIFLDETSPAGQPLPLCINDGSLATGDGTLGGTFAGVTIAENTLSEIQGWIAAFQHSHVELLVAGPDGAAAAMVDIYGMLDGIDFGPGQTRTYRIEDDPGLTYVTVMGCFGPSRGNWTAEGLADVVTVTVDQARDDLRNVHFEAEFTGDDGGESGTLRGSFQVSVNPAEDADCEQRWESFD
jgi:hypothetical protein